jgi:hypothetical protein
MTETATRSQAWALVNDDGTRTRVEYWSEWNLVEVWTRDVEYTTSGQLVTFRPLADADEFGIDDAEVGTWYRDKDVRQASAYDVFVNGGPDHAYAAARERAGAVLGELLIQGYTLTHVDDVEV